MPRNARGAWWTPWLAAGAAGASALLVSRRRVTSARETGSYFRTRWEGVSRTAHELVWELAPDGTITFINGACLRFFGATPEDLIGTNVFSLVHPADVDRATAILTQCVHESRGWTGVQLRALRGDGSDYWVETSGVAHVNHHGELVGFTATTHELSEIDLGRAAAHSVRHRIEHVLATEAFDPVLQPIFCLHDGQLLGAEALTRFSADPVRSPDRWFADAHDIGLGVELELAALSKALGAAGLLPCGYLSMNVSPATLAHPALPAVLAGGPLPIDRMVLELTEHVSVADYGALRAPMARLADLGARLAVDDAGAGFASFRHILQMRPDVIKLDQTIIRDIHTNPAQRAFAAAVVVFAMELGAHVVAEGVETAAELDVVASLGIDGAQGYLLGRPGAEWSAWPSHHPAIRRIRNLPRGA